MKYLKYLLVVAMGMAVIAAVITYKRESIVRDFANSALRGQGFTATDLSIDTLATDHVILSRLVLLRDDGSRFEFSNIAFPLSFPSFRTEIISIGALAIHAAEAGDEPLHMSELLSAFLGLPQAIPNTTVTLNELSMAGFPPVRGMVWQSSGNRERLSFGIGDVELIVDVDRDAYSASDRPHHAMVTAGIGGTPALELPVTITRQDDGFALDGRIDIAMLSWLPLLRNTGLVPDELEQLGADLAGPISMILHDDPAKPMVLTADLQSSGESTATYRATPDMLVDVRVTEAANARIRFEYPSADWTVYVPQSPLVVSTEFAGDIKVNLSDLSCQPGIHCTLHAAFANTPLQFGDIRVGHASFSATMALLVADESRIDFRPDATLTLGNVASGEMRLASLRADRSRGARIVTSESGWSAEFAGLELNVESISDGSGLRASLPLSVSALRLQDNASAISMAIAVPAKAAALSWNDIALAVPGVSGTVALHDKVFATTLDLSSDNEALTARIEATHSLVSGKGSLSVKDAVLRFDRQPLSARLPKWPYPWDVIAGGSTASAQVAWERESDDLITRASITQQFDGLSGFYNDIAFGGLTTRIAATLAPDGAIRMEPSEFSLALVDVGIPISEITASYSVDFTGPRFAVQNLGMSALGGRILADPFEYSPGDPVNIIMLRPRSVQLQFMVDLAEFDDISLSGSISGRIPVTINSSTVTVTDGRLESDAPGGVIRYKAGAAAGVNAEIGLVSRALGNFQYDSLTSDVNYTETGDLILKMRLSGINPDMDARQPVILNLGVENNIPQLLRSLQATRDIEDILRKRGMN